MEISEQIGLPRKRHHPFRTMGWIPEELEHRAIGDRTLLVDEGESRFMDDDNPQYIMDYIWIYPIEYTIYRI